MKAGVSYLFNFLQGNTIIFGGHGYALPDSQSIYRIFGKEITQEGLHVQVKLCFTCSTRYSFNTSSCPFFHYK